MGSTLRSRDVAYKIDLSREFTKYTADLFESGVLKPIIDRTFDWSETEQAHQYMNQNKNIGKIVLTGM